MRPHSPRFRQDLRVKVKVRAKDRSTPTGTVVVRIDGKKAGTAELRRGKVVLQVGKNLSVGKHRLVAIYRGSDTVNGSWDVVEFRVRPRRHR